MNARKNTTNAIIPFETMFQITFISHVFSFLVTVSTEHIGENGLLNAHI